MLLPLDDLGLLDPPIRRRLVQRFGDLGGEPGVGHHEGVVRLEGLAWAVETVVANWITLGTIQTLRERSIAMVGAMNLQGTWIGNVNNWANGVGNDLTIAVRFVASYFDFNVNPGDVLRLIGGTADIAAGLLIVLAGGPAALAGAGLFGVGLDQVISGISNIVTRQSNPSVIEAAGANAAMFFGLSPAVSHEVGALLPVGLSLAFGGLGSLLPRLHRASTALRRGILAELNTTGLHSTTGATTQIFWETRPYPGVFGRLLNVVGIRRHIPVDFLVRFAPNLGPNSFLRLGAHELGHVDWALRHPLLSYLADVAPAAGGGTQIRTSIPGAYALFRWIEESVMYARFPTFGTASRFATMTGFAPWTGLRASFDWGWTGDLIAGSTLWIGIPSFAWYLYHR